WSLPETVNNAATPATSNESTWEGLEPSILGWEGCVPLSPGRESSIRLWPLRPPSLTLSHVHLRALRYGGQGREAMPSTIWRRCAVGMFVMGVAAPFAAQQPANDPSPVSLPGHRYDLPATLITAAQIEAHKKNMIAAKEDDVPMNMVKAGGGSDKHQVGVSVVNRNKGQKNPNYAVHDDVAEVYYVVEGKGRMKLGGK